VRSRVISIDAVWWKFENAKCGSDGIVTLGRFREIFELGFFELDCSAFQRSQGKPLEATVQWLDANRGPLAVGHRTPFLKLILVLDFLLRPLSSLSLTITV
jgi:hypothetical protein